MVARDQGRQDGGNDTLAEEEVDLDKGETGATVDGDCSRGYDGQGDRNEDDEDDENNSPENGELEDPESNRKSGKVANSEPVGDSEQGVTPITNSKTPSTPPLHDSSDMKWTPVHPDSLTSIISLMSCRGWSTYYLYNQRRDSSKKKWLQHYEPNPMFKEWERLADAAYTLFEIYQATARVPHYGQQLSHLRRNETVLKETHASLERVYTEMLDEIETSERHDRLQLAAKIHGTVIPLVVMCLQEAFLMGTASDKLTVARFTTTTLQQVWRHCMSIRKLYDAISEVYLVDGLQHDQEASSPAHKSSPATKNRNYLHRHLSALSKDICQAQERLDSRKCARLDETQQLWRECRDEERIRREYLNKHGWELSEDEALLDVLRGQQTLSLAVMRACAPSRTELDVRQRVNVLRDKAMRVLAQRGLEIPDWCR
ncbi:hypothetical protein CDD81_863 [Ophiocordyceps australis]|uniref:Uncharacterized protein n=1 Tax=Ophiocordyceps australis TaxID=1399860 RepID=A0A2C5Y8V5_9HYPO|nr:hypothetical protein CDD81_863 [Ophiocordyceps australis]